jgi:hypothetical protein
VSRLVYRVFDGRHCGADVRALQAAPLPNFDQYAGDDRFADIVKPEVSVHRCCRTAAAACAALQLTRGHPHVDIGTDTQLMRSHTRSIADDNVLACMQVAAAAAEFAPERERFIQAVKTQCEATTSAMRATVRCV